MAWLTERIQGGTVETTFPIYLVFLTYHNMYIYIFSLLLMTFSWELLPLIKKFAENE